MIVDARTNALIAVELDDADWTWFVPRAQRACDVLLAAAVMLAPRVEVCEAMLCGALVRSERLHPAWVQTLALSGDVVLDPLLALRVVAQGPIQSNAEVHRGV